jgi:hypothetical protein
MPAIPEALGGLVLNKVRKNFTALGHDPMSGRNPSYFIEFCTAIGKGIAKGTPTLTFETKDSGATAVPPIPGVGTGVGVKVDSDYMSQKIYTAARNAVIQKFNQTMHDPWPPKEGNSGLYLKALSDGISEAVKEHYSSCWILTSAHPQIYAGSGIINPNSGSKFSGVIDSAVAAAITAFGVRMKGPYWPVFCQAVAKGYKDGIENKATGTVTITGICVPSQSQACNIASSGSGTGAAS